MKYCFVLVLLLALFTQNSPSQSAIEIKLPEYSEGEGNLVWKSFRWEDEAPVGGDQNTHPGKSLAIGHCSRCHVPPVPGQLPREFWPWTLAWMGNYVGYPDRDFGIDFVVESDRVESVPLFSIQDFREIATYYQVYAPTESEIRARSKHELKPIRQFVSRPFPGEIPKSKTVTLIRYRNDTNTFFLGRERLFSSYNSLGTQLFEIGTPSEAIDLEFTDTGMLLAVMGDFGRDERRGHVVNVKLTKDEGLKFDSLVTGYHRLVEAESHDFDLDGFDDLLLVGFGDFSKGRVSIKWGKEDGSYDEETILIDYGGAVKADIRDYDGDGVEDIAILTAQERQELLLFRKSFSRQYDHRILIKEGVGFGFTHFEAVDLDGDNSVDLVLSNGNNMEIEGAPLKPHHGIRVMRNDGALNFEESYFYPMFGGLKSVVKDFDNDGDLDIAAISFLPDWEIEWPESFVYLENKGDFDFEPFGLESKDWGRWISISTGDVNSDGFEDILLGGGYLPMAPRLQYKERYEALTRDRDSVVILENIGTSRK